MHRRVLELCCALQATFVTWRNVSQTINCECLCQENFLTFLDADFRCVSRSRLAGISGSFRSRVHQNFWRVRAAKLVKIAWQPVSYPPHCAEFFPQPYGLDSLPGEPRSRRRNFSSLPCCRSGRKRERFNEPKLEYPNAHPDARARAVEKRTTLWKKRSRGLNCDFGVPSAFLLNSKKNLCLPDVDLEVYRNSSSPAQELASGSSSEPCDSTGLPP